MTTQSNSTNPIRINVEIQPTPDPSASGDLGQTLFVTESVPVDVSPSNPRGWGSAEIVRSYSSVEDVLRDFPNVNNVASEPVKAARKYFGQSTYPKDFLIGRYTPTAETTVTGYLLGATAPIPFGGSDSLVVSTIPSRNVSFMPGASADATATALQADMRLSGYTDAEVVAVQNDTRFLVKFVTVPGNDVVDENFFNGAEAVRFGLTDGYKFNGITADIRGLTAGQSYVIRSTEPTVSVNAVSTTGATRVTDTAAALQVAIRDALDANAVVVANGTERSAQFTIYFDDSMNRVTPVSSMFDGPGASGFGLSGNGVLVENVSVQYVAGGGPVFTGLERPDPLTGGLGANKVIMETPVEIEIEISAAWATTITALQNALRGAGFPLANVQRSPTTGGSVARFVVEFSPIGNLDNANFGVGMFDGVDATLLGLSGLGVSLSNNIAITLDKIAEVTAAPFDRNNADAYIGSFYFVTLDRRLNPGNIDGTNRRRIVVEAVREWVEQRSKMFVAETYESDTLTLNDATSVAALEYAEHPKRTWYTYSSDPDDYKAVAIASHLSSVDFNDAGSLITAKWRVLQDCTPQRFTSAELQELDRKNINYYRRYGASGIYAEGKTLESARSWIDVQYWLDWLTIAIQEDLDRLLTSSSRVPLTSAGMVLLHQTVADVCARGVDNGGIAPGVVSPQTAQRIREVTGEVFDGRLSTGYLVHIAPLSTLTQLQRENERLAPDINVFLKGSGAVHNAEINLRFEN